MSYKVTYYADSLDPKPEIRFFDTFDEMQDDIDLDVQTRMDFFVSHYPHLLTETEIEQQREIEYSLIKIEELKWDKDY